MEVGVLSMRYAKAMIEYAQEKGVEDRLYNEFFILSHSFRTQPGLREALDNPVISMKDKLVLVCTAADGDGKSSREFIDVSNCCAFLLIVFSFLRIPSSRVSDNNICNGLMISVSGVRKSWLIFVKNFSFISFRSNFCSCSSFARCCSSLML